MFTKTRIRLQTFKVAFWHLVNVLQELTAALEANSAKVAALAAEQKELRSKLDTIVEHSGYMVSEKRRELIRAGHRS